MRSEAMEIEYRRRQSRLPSLDPSGSRKITRESRRAKRISRMRRRIQRDQNRKRSCREREEERTLRKARDSMMMDSSKSLRRNMEIAKIIYNRNLIPLRKRKLKNRLIQVHSLL